MKYLKRYEKFITNNINKSNKIIDKNLRVVENLVLTDFSKSFWDLSLNSSVFTDEEKSFIKENLTDQKIDLIKEGWLSDTLKDTWVKAKEVGGKIWDKVKSKIDIIKENIKKLCSGISDFVKSLLKSIGNSLVTKSNSIKEKVKVEFPEKIKTMASQKKWDDNELSTELKQLSETYKHLGDVIKVGLFSSNVDVADDSVINAAGEQVSELESELKNESIENDILKSFYITENAEEVEYKVGDVVKYKMKDGGESEKEIIKIDGDNFFFNDKEGKEFSKNKSEIIGKKTGTVAKVWAGFAKWFLDMEQATPPVKGKAVWWIKLILKIVSLVLSPIVKALEVGAKFISSNILKATSHTTKYLKGPGVFEFLILGGIVAGIPALITEFNLVSHKMPEEWAHIFEVVSHFLSEAAGFKVLVTIFGAICTTMTFAQLCIEFKHLLGHGHH